MTIGQQPWATGMARVQRSSTIDLITHQLRNAIYEGMLMPGAPIQEAQAAKQLGVSRGSLRESTQRLVQDGLLISIPGQGLSVAQIRTEDLEELYATRLMVEGTAIRVIAARPSANERAKRMEAATAALTRLEALSTGPEALEAPRSIGDADLALHSETVRAAGNLHLTKYMATLVMETRLASLGNPGGYVIRTDVHLAHRERLDLVLAGDGNGAVDLLERHFNDTVDRLTGVPGKPVATARVELDEAGSELGPIGA
ncbi:MAG: GntR family transcriptional regulator [Micrococcaceae bacterium]|nr:GntR family transcriptional regulator [Micrococcaceae bacterium]